MCIIHIDAIKIFFNRNKDSLAFESINQSKSKGEEMEIPVEKRIRRKKKPSREKEDDVCQTLLQEVKRNLDECQCSSHRSISFRESMPPPSDSAIH